MIVLAVVLVSMLLLVAPHAAAQTEPSITEPPGLNRTLWEQLIFDTYDCPSPECEPPLEERTTTVLTHGSVRTMAICHPQRDEPGGELLEKFDNEEWWREIIQYWTDLQWNGQFRLGGCDGTPPNGWVYVRGEPLGGSRAGQAQTQTEADGNLRWALIEMATDRDFYRTETTDSVEVVLAHELGHVLGFNHVEDGHGYVMRGEYFWPTEEAEMTKLAYRVGTGVLYPGVVYVTQPEPEPEPEPVPALPLLGQLLLGLGLAGAGAMRLGGPRGAGSTHTALAARAGIPRLLDALLHPGQACANKAASFL